MKISLKLLTFITLTTIVAIVAATCLGVTLAIIVQTIYQVGEAWATSVTHSVGFSVATWLANLKHSLDSATILAQANDLPSPGSMKAMGKGNWTDTWATWALGFFAKHNTTTTVISCVFVDYFWLYTSNSMFDNPGMNFAAIQWLEHQQNASTVPSQEQMTVGGFRFDRSSFTKSTNFTDEILFANNSLVVLIEPFIKQLFLYLYPMRAKEDPSVSLFVLRHTYVPLSDGVSFRNWEAYIVVAIFGRNGLFLGFASLDLDLELVLPALLKGLKKTPNSESFLIYDNSYIIATTRPESYWWSWWTPHNESIPTGCMSTDEVPLPKLTQQRIGCMKTIHTYPYAPLNAISDSFATTPTFAFDFFKVSDGTTAAIASERIQTTVIGLIWNLVVVLPEEDLYLGQVKNSIGLSVGLVVLVLVATVGIALLLLHFLVKRLEKVQYKMLRLAEMNTLDHDENIQDDDETEDETNAGEDAVDVFFGRKRKNNNHNIDGNEEKKRRSNDESDVASPSWIAEVANLENAYAETVKSLTNFTRYVSRAVVSELIIQRKMTLQKQELKNDQQQKQLAIELLPGMVVPNSSSSDDHANGILSHDAARLRDAQIDANIASEYDVTILIAEIEGFSSQIWATNPENHDGVLYILHIYFKRMCRLIMGHGGVVDKFMGDSIMSYWGAPVRTEHHALLATLAALSMLRESKRDPLKKIFTQTLKREVKLRCGLSSGPAVVGTFGNAEYVNYSVVGAPVTQSRQIQQFNKYWFTSILMDGNCMRKVGDVVVHRLICQAQFIQAESPRFIYEVMGLNPDSKQVRDTLSSDLRTIAFTDVLSLPTINSNNQGVEEILHTTSPEHASTVSSLLSWHGKGRTVVPRRYAEFAEKFSDASRAIVECRFVDAHRMFTELLAFELTNSPSTTTTTTVTRNQQNSSLDSQLETANNNSNTAIVANVNINNNNNRQSSSSVPSSVSILSDDFPFRFFVEKDKPLKMLIDIAKLYLKKSPHKSALDQATGTFFIRAHKLSGLASSTSSDHRNDDENNNNNSKSGEAGAASATAAAEATNNTRLKSKIQKSENSNRNRGNDGEIDDVSKNKNKSSNRRSSSSSRSSNSSRESSSASSKKR